ncbi:homoserine kinase [Marinicella sp. W31]|uniref:homoserine kinase n=1 Tax=Marinicella sp. W31 TaxID=3023713 RepID=UPI003756BC96
MKIFAPATIGNFSVGFDLLGLAIQPVDGTLLGDIIEITETDKNGLTLGGDFHAQLPATEDNLVTKAHQLFEQELNQDDIIPCHLYLEKNLPIGSGLGSSSASIIATLTALNHKYGLPFSAHKLLEMAGRLEGDVSGSIHYDNVAPALLGGLQLMTAHEEYPSTAIPIPEDWFIVIAHPGIRINTAEARAILPTEIPLKTCIRFAQNLTAFVDCMHKEDPDRAAEFLFDVIAEPHRMRLIPGFEGFRDFARTVGAIGTGISGSGPTVFAVCTEEDIANRIAENASSHFCQGHGFAHVCLPDFIGARIIHVD